MNLRIENFILFGTLLMVLFGLLIIGFVVYYQRKQFRLEIKQNQEKQKIELEFQRKMLETTMEVQENERRRLAKDLHDEVGALLSVLKMGNNQLLKNIPKDQKINDLAQNNHELIEESIFKVRSISKDLLPQTLENFGLFSAIEEFFGKLNRNSDIEFNLIFDGVDTTQRYESKIELSLYRVIQELVNNVIKHSNSTKCILTIKYSKNGLNLIFEDNGKGFLPQPQINAPKAGLGMRNIESRLSVINAKLKIDSQIQKGSKFEIELINSHE